jgi:hypothetical protein
MKKLDGPSHSWPTPHTTPLDAVSQEVADFVGDCGGAAQRSDMTAHREPFAFTVHARGVNGQLKSDGGVVGTSEDDLKSGSKNRANLVALFRLLHAHVVQQDVAGNDSSITSSAACPRSVPELVSVAERQRPPSGDGCY